MIPFTLDGHAFLRVTINGTAAQLVFDPIEGVILDRGFVRRAGLRHLDWRGLGQPGPSHVRGAGAADLEVSWAPDLQVALGDSVYRFARAPVIPLDSMMPGSFRQRPDGLLGADLLAGYAARFDFARGQLELRPSGAPAPAGATVLAIEILNRRPVVAATITLPDGDTHRVRLLLDFGMAGGIRMTTRAVDSLRLVERLQAVPRRRMETGLGGVLESMEGTLPQVRLGGIVLNDYRVSLAREASGADANPAWDGLIGLELLSRYVMTYDPTAGRLVLDPGSPR